MDNVECNCPVAGQYSDNNHQGPICDIEHGGFIHCLYHLIKYHKKDCPEIVQKILLENPELGLEI